MAYTLTLTEQDIRDIATVGGRYHWSAALLAHPVEEGKNVFTEEEVRVIEEAFLADTKGGHGWLPTEDGRGELAQKLLGLVWDIV